MIHARKLRASARRSNKILTPRANLIPFPKREKITCVFEARGQRLNVNPMQQTVSNTGDAGSVVHLLVRVEDVKMVAEDPELVMEEMWTRATQVSSVLEDILHEPHGEPRWGLNE
jgi:hypothetical protein